MTKKEFEIYFAKNKIFANYGSSFFMMKKGIKLLEMVRFIG